jgi:VWFA-related protein
MRLPRYSACLLLMALGPSVAGQRLRIPPADESIDVRVVNVEAQVTDASGRPVHGLAASDFRLWVDKEEVPVTYFSEVAESAVAAAPSPAASGPVATPAVAPVPAARNLLVFIDDSVAIGIYRDFALQRLERDLSGLGAGDRVAVVAFDGAKLAVLSGWSGDREALAAALAKARRRPPGGIGILAARRGDVDTNVMAQETLHFDDFSWRPSGVPDAPQRFSGDPFLQNPQLFHAVTQVAEAAGAALRALPVPAGRKALLLLSGGMPLGEPKPLIRDAGQLGYTVYPVEIQRIDVLAAPNDASHAYITDSTHPLSTDWQQFSDWSFSALATETGGRVLSGRDGALAQVMIDTSSYYSLGFAPKSGDGMHKVRVEVRRPRLQVRARRQYFSLTPGTMARIAAQGVLMYGGDPAARQITVEVGAARRATKREVEVPVTFQLPVEVLAMTVADPGYQAELTLGAMAADSDGRLSDVSGLRLQASFPVLPGSRDMARFHAVVRLRAGRQHVVFVAPDLLGGAPIWGEANVGG